MFLFLLSSKHALHNAQKYLREYKKADRELIAKRRVAKQTNTFYVEAEPKVVFVIRIRGTLFLTFFSRRKERS
jgi:hypothetical protein